MTDEKPTYEALEDRIRQLEDELKQREVLERELEAGRNILTEAERLANFGGWMWDIEQDVWSMTANWLQIHGCSKPVLSTSELLKIAHPDDLPAITAAFEQAVSLGRPYAIEHRILRQDTGEVRTIQAYGAVRQDRSGKAVTMHGAAQDITGRKQRLSALEESQERYRALVESSADHIFMLSLDGVYLASNNRIGQFGLQEGQSLVGCRLEDVYPPDVAELYRQQMQAVTTTGRALDFEHPMHESTGRRVHLDTLYPIYRDGAIASIGGICRDITDRRRMEQNLQESEERFNLALDSVNDGVWDWRVDTGEVYFNSVWYTMLGYEPNAMPQAFSTWQQLVHPDDLPGAEETIWSHLELGKPFSMEFRMRSQEGSWRWILARGRVVEKGASGQAVRMIGTHMDITERKQAEEALQQSYIDLKLAQRTAKIGNWTFDPEADRPTWSDLIYEIYERDPGLGAPSLEEYRDIYQGKHFHRFWTAIQAAIQDGIPYNIELLLELPDREPKWVQAICEPSPHRGPKGHVLRGTIQDITAHKQTERSLIAAKEAADSANRAKSEFLANMSHEIRTPLNGIMGMLQVMQTTQLDPEQKDYVDIATTSTKRLTRLLNDILDLTRIEADKLAISEETFEFSEVIQSIQDIFAQAARDTGNTLTVTMDERVPARIVGDSNRLTQILFNLVGNALKFTLHGHIDVQTQPLPWGPKASQILFSVSDTGPGIPEHNLHDIFETFTQISTDSSVYSRQHEGAGLGLPLVQRLVSLMGGTLAIDSQEGRGTTVHVSLPFSLPKSQDLHPSGPQSDPRPTSLPWKVLLVDDDAMTQFYVRHLLEKQGMDIQIAENGEKALNRLGEEQFDCVLMDIQMPVMDGVEATRRIRSSSSGFRSIPIIALTAYAMAGDRETFIQAGMDDYLAKPVDKDDLIETLSRNLVQEGLSP